MVRRTRKRLQNLQDYFYFCNQRPFSDKHSCTRKITYTHMLTIRCGQSKLVRSSRQYYVEMVVILRLWSDIKPWKSDNKLSLRIITIRNIPTNHIFLPCVSAPHFNLAATTSGPKAELVARIVKLVSEMTAVGGFCKLFRLWWHLTHLWGRQ